MEVLDIGLIAIGLIAVIVVIVMIVCLFKINSYNKTSSDDMTLPEWNGTSTTPPTSPSQADMKTSVKHWLAASGILLTFFSILATIMLHKVLHMTGFTAFFAVATLGVAIFYSYLVWRSNQLTILPGATQADEAYITDKPMYNVLFTVVLFSVFGVIASFAGCVGLRQHHVKGRSKAKEALKADIDSISEHARNAKNNLTGNGREYWKSAKPLV